MSTPTESPSVEDNRTSVSVEPTAPTAPPVVDNSNVSSDQQATTVPTVANPSQSGGSKSSWEEAMAYQDANVSRVDRTPDRDFSR